MNTLEERIARLERSVRRYQRALLMFAGVALLVVVGGQAKARQERESDRLVISDAHGRERVRLGKLGSDKWGLEIVDAGGKPRITVGAEDDGSSSLVGIVGPNDDTPAVVLGASATSVDLVLRLGDCSARLGTRPAGTSLEIKGGARAPALVRLGATAHHAGSKREPRRFAGLAVLRADLGGSVRVGFGREKGVAGAVSINGPRGAAWSAPPR